MNHRFPFKCPKINQKRQIAALRQFRLPLAALVRFWLSDRCALSVLVFRSLRSLKFGLPLASLVQVSSSAALAMFRLQKHQNSQEAAFTDQLVLPAMQFQRCCIERVQLVQPSDQSGRFKLVMPSDQWSAVLGWHVRVGSGL